MAVFESHLTLPRKGIETLLLSYLRVVYVVLSHLTLPRKGIETTHIGFKEFDSAWSKLF